ncbi:MAG: PAS domain S-box protein [Candidatus Omnitrophica bacterium]|nr:PAS domain S-box protein [Candidatus Omnitrophota bacterium]
MGYVERRIMAQTNKTKEKLVNEIKLLQKRIAKLETTDAERKQQQQQQQQQEEIRNLAKFPEENPNPIYRVSKGGVLLYANPASRKLILEDQTKIGDKIPEKWIGMIKGVYDSGKRQQVEIELSARVFLFDLFPVIKGGYVNSYATDITGHKQAEERIKVFSDAINSASDCFMLTDLKGNITYANVSASRTFGYTPEEFLKLNISKLDADPRVAKKITQEVAKKEKWRGEVTNIRTNGEKFPSFLSAFIIRDDKGNPKGTMGILRDITEIKKTEEDLKKAYSKLELDKRLLTEKNIAFRVAIEEIEIEKNRLKDEIMTNVSEIVLPILKRIRLKEKAARKHLDLLEKNLRTLTSSFGRKLIDRQLRLTPKEVAICNMVKSGLATKEISGILNISTQTIDKHRKNIRKKLGLSKKDINLTSFLQNL